jgi:uncharacterized Zn finger protein (UPF0148 family)
MSAVGDTVEENGRKLICVRKASSESAFDEWMPVELAPPELVAKHEGEPVGKSVCPSCGRPTGKIDGFLTCPECRRAEENKMSKDDEKFEAFRAKIEAVMKSLPTDDDRERFLQIVAALAGKIDSQAFTKRSIKRDVMGEVTKALDRLAQQEGWAGLLSKALQKADVADEDEMPGVDDDWRRMRDEVNKAIKRAAFQIPQVSSDYAPGQPARAVLDVRREIEEEQGGTPLAKDTEGVGKQRIPSYSGTPLETSTTKVKK